MFIIVGSFLFRYCLGYYSFEFMKCTNRKHEIREFFLSYNKNMAFTVYFLSKKLEEIKISDDIVLGNDLSYEEKILNSVIEYLEQKIDYCEVSY